MTAKNIKPKQKKAATAKTTSVSPNKHDVTHSYGSKEIATKQISDQAKRALKEAEERRKNYKPTNLPKELDGRNGPEPTRYGDWEKDGIASDF